MNVYVCSISEFTELEGVERLSSARRLQMGRYRNNDDKARCLAAGLLLNYALGDAAMDIQQGEHGKPYCKNENIFFNISHSGDCVVLAVDEYDVGIDIERIERYHQGISAKAFTMEEQEWLAKQKEKTAFFRLWTGKESVMKATGLGFSLEMNSFSVLPAETGYHTINGTEWYMRWCEIKDCILCSCSHTKTDNLPVYLTKRDLLK